MAVEKVNAEVFLLKRGSGWKVGSSIVCLWIVLLLAGCGSLAPLQKSAEKSPGADARPVLRIGASPFESVAKTRDQLQELMGFLEKRTGMRLELMVTQDYQGLIDKMGRLELDFALLGPFGYVQANAKSGAQAFVGVQNNVTGKYYQSLIITHVDSGIRSLPELKGRSFAFVDQSSTSGYLIPRAVLRKQGIDPALDLLPVMFVGRHDAAVLAVKKRTVDAAAVSQTIFNSMLRKGLFGQQELVILHQSEPIPGSVWAFRPGVSPELIDTVSRALLEAKAENALGVFGRDIGSFFVTDDRAYDIIREAAQMKLPTRK